MQIYSADTILKGIGPAWSLCTELLFYAALPFLAVALGRVWRGGRRRGVRAELAVLAALGLASLGFRAAIELGDGASYLTQTILGTFDGFALGMALAVASVALADGREQPARRPARDGAAGRRVGDRARLLRRRRRDRRARPGLPARDRHAGGRGAGGPRARPADRRRAARARHVRRRPRAARPAACSPCPALAWLGAISYGIYLWHYPIIQRVTVGPDMEGFPGGSGWKIAAISVPIVIACAALSYHLVERPLLRRVSGRRPPRPVPASPPP